MNPVRVKICGLTRAADVELAIDAGADVVGFVFARSPRQVDEVRAAQLARVAAGRPRRVGLFMDPDVREVERVLAAVDLDL